MAVFVNEVKKNEPVKEVTKSAKAEEVKEPKAEKKQTRSKKD